MLRLANELGVPVTARGTRHRPVGRVHPARRRHRRVVRADERDPRDRHREPRRGRRSPASRSTSSTRRLAPHGLVYPVFPGENSASLGGNVATNAGGMRAVKYGVTRHQVLGLEAVLADRRGHPHRRQVREGDDRLRPHPARSSAPRARSRSSPRRRCGSTRGPRTRRPCSRRSPTLDEVTAAVPRIVAQRRRPADPRVHRLHHDGGDRRATSGSSSASPEDVQGRGARVPRRRAREHAATTASTRTSRRSPSSSPSSARSTCTCCRRRAARAADRSAREGVLGREGDRRRRHRRRRRAARVDPRVHGSRSPTLAQRTGSLDRRLRARRRRQRPPLGVPDATPRCGTACMHEHLRGRHGARRRDLRRARHRHGEEAVLPRARGPGQARADAPDQGRVRPERHPQPRHASSTTRRRLRTDHERCPGAASARSSTAASTSASRIPARRRCTSSPRSTTCPRCAACSRLFEGVATGAADGYARMADRPAATLLHLGPGLGNGLANLHNARTGAHADRQHRRRPRHLPQAVRRAARVRHRDAWPRNVSRLDPRVGDAPTSVGARRGRRGRGRVGPPGQVATLILPADVSWARRRRAGGPRRAPRRRARSTDGVEARRQGAALGRAGGAARSAATRVPRARAARARARDRRRDRRQAAVRDVPGPARARRRPARGRAPRLPRRVRGRAARRAAPPRARRRARRRCRSSRIPGKAERPRARRLRGARARRRRDDAVARARGARRRARRAARRRRRAPAAARPEPPDRRAHRADASPRRSARCCPRARSSSDEAQTRRAVRRRRDRRRAAARLAVRSPAARSARACRSRPAPRSRAPTGRCSTLEADGSAMYTLQSLWTQAREGLDVTTIIFNNRSYAILNMELGRVGRGERRPAGRGDARPLAAPTSTSSRWPRGMGVPATRVETADELVGRARQGARRARAPPHRGRAPPLALIRPDARHRWPAGVRPSRRLATATQPATGVEPADHPGRHPHRDGVVGQLPAHDAARAHHHVAADAGAGQHDHAVAEPRAGADRHRRLGLVLHRDRALGVVVAVVHVGDVDVVAGPHVVADLDRQVPDDAAAGADQAAIADGDDAGRQVGLVQHPAGRQRDAGVDHRATSRCGSPTR